MGGTIMEYDIKTFRLAAFRSAGNSNASPAPVLVLRWFLVVAIVSHTCTIKSTAHAQDVCRPSFSSKPPTDDALRAAVLAAVNCSSL